ncbi:PR domain zinc finger protein 10-like [Leptopilina boulardi]|uniref:PR domain zinc finger protein 10-like n=1 Tax=Leptopilina boulardi TaxID=63433 RepID=UPI0021F67970|nr:PR domain zinc finger protein 10-like [Leptopilina boulardi]XP_051170021.1 PR domain zinc finger protein 10-like [Leptopilina boulardi]
MDPRAPPEGAPGDTLEMAGIDKISDETWSSDNNVPSPLCEQRKKMNNKLLFLTVEYVEDQTRDYARMFSVYEPVSYSPRASSPLSEFEHRVSPHDPNMSSAARYSPTPVQLPPSPFQNSVVVLQNSSTSLNSSSETNNTTNINFVAELTDQNTSPNIPQNDNTTDFVESNNEEGLVPGNELILMQGTNSELEPSAPPLMLTGSDFALTRDFLVMHDDQISVMNSFKSENLEISETYIPSPMQNLNTSEEIDLCSTVEPEKILNTMKIVDNLLETKNEETSKKIVRRSKRQINDKKTYWCTECDSICADEDGCMSHNVQTIADQPVPSRAIATLPSSYLSINKLNSNDSLEQNYGVFAKKIIRKRTQFGPIEGILCAYDGTLFSNVLPLLFENEDGDFFKVDVSNENTSNWMRFVRPALTYKDQNLMICQQNEGIIFLTTRDILPKEELRAGPNPEYAKKRNLKILEADTENANDTNGDSWPCFECNRQFPTSGTLQSHLNVHDSPRNESKARSKRRKLHIASNKLFKVVNDQKILYTCPHCSKVFSRSYSLKRHLLIHPNNKTTSSCYECSKCGENFLYSNNLCRHMKICQNENEKNKEKGKENSGQNSEWKCTICNLTFYKESLFDLHKIGHNDNILENGCKFIVCPECGVKFEKQNELIKHVSQHGKMPMKKITNTTNNTSAAYKCSMCYKRFATKVRLQQHCLVHGAEDQKPLPCNICFKRFMNNSALSCHLKTHRKEKQMFECPMCKVLFDQILMLKDHVETHRNQDDTFTCPHCQRNFTKYSVIRKHIRAHHCERKHKCTFCVKRFPTVDKLRMHLLRHSDHREFQCAICGKRFKRKDKLKEHVTRMHNSQRPNKEATSPINQVKKFVPKVNPTEYDRFVYKCHQCLVGFKRRGMLVNHLAKRHPDVPPESVPELNLPILRQTRDYYCQYCEKVYKSSSKRKAHIMKNHPGAALPPSNRHKETDIPGLPNSTFSQTVGSVTTTPQGCQWCHKQYASKAKLLQHQRKKHSSLMEPADQVPRPRNRPTHNSNDELVLGNINFVMTNNVNLINDEFDSVSQQFVRMRDIR